MLVQHEWTGIGDYGRMRADMLTRFGDVALAADLYGADARPHAAGGTRGRGPVLQGLASAPEPTRRQLRDPARPAGRRSGSRRRIGYCFGGAAALQLAFTGIDVGGVVSFHGSLQTGPEGEAAGIRPKVLVLHGAADPMVPDAAVHALADELRAAPALDWQLTAYSGAMPAFTMPDVNVPELGAQFNPPPNGEAGRR